MTTQDTPRCAIIVCHPRKESFCSALAQRARSAAEMAGYQTLVRDLYMMAFEPVLQAREIAQNNGANRPAADVELELVLLGNPAVVVLVYPIWFGSAPGLLKGYIERVLGAGFAGPGTVPSPASARPQLLITIATSGASSEWLVEKGIAASAGRTFGAYLAGALAIPRAEHIAIDNVTPTLSKARADAALKKVEQRVRTALPTVKTPEERSHPHWQTLPSPTA